MRLQRLHTLLMERLNLDSNACEHALNELTLTISSADLLSKATQLRDDPDLSFAMLIDVTAIDYLEYGIAEWQTDEKTGSGYCRGVTADSHLQKLSNTQPSRFAVVYHLMSLEHNWRLRLKVFLDDNDLRIKSVIDIWPVANWFEREVFDLFGILFEGHPDLRRILTDYGFVGHPFRKDFPLSGHVEMRYDAASQRVIYEPVDIEPRVLVPKVIRSENDYGRARDEQVSNEESHG